MLILFNCSQCPKTRHHHLRMICYEKFCRQDLQFSSECPKKWGFNLITKIHLSKINEQRCHYIQTICRSWLCVTSLRVTSSQLLNIWNKTTSNPDLKLITRLLGLTLELTLVSTLDGARLWCYDHLEA